MLAFPLPASALGALDCERSPVPSMFAAGIAPFKWCQTNSRSSPRSHVSCARHSDSPGGSTLLGAGGGHFLGGSNGEVDAVFFLDVAAYSCKTSAHAS
ncbi:hypothetical protein KC19_VG271900 [Ceratodon purpureus]|uniref:Uncharacterized protein n=1 Tax=Ceratodon purpureus TaxID=3225 RepID=A0A8T0HVM5_CERPU|nr:hypothetical protein KC19_VG271900 [Ceratodon purpureus]